jgi:antirestriction protein ArdC
MNTEQAKQLSETALTRLMTALEEGQSAVLKQYLAVMARFRRYSSANVLLIYSQRPEASHVGGYHFWLKLSRHVRKGEKGIAILAPMVGRKRSSDEEQPAEDERTRVFGFKSCHVWDRLSRDSRESALALVRK